MNVARTAAEVLDEDATLELECVDRMYLNAYVPVLQTCGGAAWFFRKVRGKPVPSSALMAPMTRNFVAAIERFAERAGVELVKFGRRERKEERMREHLRRWPGGEGVLFVGKAREKARVVRSERREHEPSGSHYVQLVHATAMVDHYYFYDPREPRPGASRPRAADLRPARHATDPFAVPDPRGHRRGGAVAARGLQALPHQAVLQGRARVAHRDGGQRHPVRRTGNDHSGWAEG